MICLQLGREMQYTKLHAPYEVLADYAQKLKICMPMKEPPLELKNTATFEMFLRPFALNPDHVPPVTKRFTCPFQTSKAYLFDIPEDKEEFFPSDVRTRIVNYILGRERYSDDQAQIYHFG